MKNRLILFLISNSLLITTISQAVTPTIGYNIKNSGAKGDGIALDSKAINTTIDAAAKAGGGTVFFPQVIGYQ